MKRLMTALISITLLSLTSAWAQYTVKGQIVDAVGPVIGAAVLEQGTLNGTESDMDGNFTLTVSSASSMIEISLIGYKTLVFQADQMPPIITLEDDTEMLEEVVVIGYGTVKKEDLTGSVATVRADQLNKGAVTSPTEMLKGKSAGVVITEGDGAPGSGSTIRIRGGSSLNAQNSPLIVIDGLPITNEGISGVADQLSSINPSDIETFTVLKDASATAIYGSRASNGVIIITTKKGSKYDSAIPHVSADYTLSISQNAKYLDVMTGDEVRAAMLAYTGSETSEGYLALGDANTDWQRAIYQLGMSHEANVSLSGNFKFGEAGYMPYRVSGGYLNEKGTLKTGSMERGTISLNLNPTFFDDHLTISLNGKGMFQNNRFANTGAISAAIEYDPTQPVYSEDHGLDGYWMWGNVMPDGTFEPNTQATINPLAALMQRNDVSKASRFIGNVPFATEENSVGATGPDQILRYDLYEWLVNEITGENNFRDALRPAASTEYGRTSQDFATMLLAKLYLNAEVFTADDPQGRPVISAWAECAAESKKIVEAYTTLPEYQWNFSADNNLCPEIIFAVQSDGTNIQTYGSTNFVIKGSIVSGNPTWQAALGTNDGWGGLVVTPQFLDLFDEAADQRFLFTDGAEFGEQAHTREILDNANFANGWCQMKFTNLKHDGSPADNSTSSYPDTDYPVFRAADAYLMLAEAQLRNGGIQSDGLDAYNAVRTRAGLNAVSSVDLDDIIDERGRELYWENMRRQDLVRFGLLTTSEYLWDWKGGSYEGNSVDDRYNLYPIPTTEINSNSKLEQNPGY